MIGNSGGHRWRDSQGLVNPSKIVVNKVDCHCRDMVLDFLGKGIGEARKAAHPHPHGEILAFNITGAYVLWVWISAHYFHVTADAAGRRILPLRFHRSAIDFLQSGEISIATKSTFDRFQVSAVTVCSDLNASSDTTGAIVHKFFCPTCIPAANQIADTEFCICVDSRPCPDITPTRLLLLRGCILGFSANKAPNFIALQTANPDIANVLIVVLTCSGGHVHQQLSDRVNGDITKAASGTKAVSLDQHSQDSRSLFQRQAIHGYKHNQHSKSCQAYNSV